MNGITINGNTAELIQRLTAEEAGTILQALIAKENGMELPLMVGAIGIVWDLICSGASCLKKERESESDNDLHSSSETGKGEVKKRKRKEATEEERENKSKAAKKRWEKKREESVVHLEHTPLLDECEEQIITVDEEGNKEECQLISDDGIREEKIITDDSEEREAIQQEASEAEAEQKKETAEERKKKRLEEMFETFWKEYPRKQGKKTAFTAFHALCPSEKLYETMMTALQNQKRSEQWIKGNGQFIPLPATWIHGKRWEDELTIDLKKEKYEPMSTEEIFADPDKFLKEFWEN